QAVIQREFEELTGEELPEILIGTGWTWFRGKGAQQFRFRLSARQAQKGVLLRGEVVEECARGNVCAFGDLFDGDVVQAQFARQVYRGGFEREAGFPYFSFAQTLGLGWFHGKQNCTSCSVAQ